MPHLEGESGQSRCALDGAVPTKFLPMSDLGGEPLPPLPLCSNCFENWISREDLVGNCRACRSWGRAFTMCACGNGIHLPVQ
ncbi:hypothetical protein ACSMXN_20250 [Jatrophihabitans sp. DSM 45814]